MRREAAKSQQPDQSSCRARRSKPSPFHPKRIISPDTVNRKPFFTPVVQPKLTVNAPDDKYEQEADRVADAVMRMPDPLVSRQPMEEEEEEEEEEKHLQRAPLVGRDTPFFQRKEGGGREVNGQTAIGLQTAKSGQRLPENTRSWMENRFGTDFSGVRVHTGSNAVQLSRELNAKAFTHGSDIYFNRGEFSPGTSKGKRLLVHELTHVVQQNNEIRSISDKLSQPHNLNLRNTIQRQDEPPAPETEDCVPWQEEMLMNHLKDARTWVNEAAKKVSAYAYVFASSRHSAVPRSPETAAVVRDALMDNFHTTDPGHVLVIKDNFLSLRSELNGSFIFECEDESCEDQAYVRGAFAPIRRLGDIHVCPPWYEQDYFRRVTTLIHERAHQYPGATDNAYEWEAGYNTLSPEEAIDNAESYAVAARQIYHGGALGPG